MKKRIYSCLIVALLAFSCVFCFVACDDATKTNSTYNINAVYDHENKKIDATMELTFVNNTETKLENVLFHLYPRAYRNGAKISPIEATDYSRAYPNGINYGDLNVLSVIRDGVNLPVNLIGEDSDILRVDGEIKPAQSTKITLDFRLELPNVRHRLGHFNDITNLGNWFPIVCGIKNGEFMTTPYYSQGDPFVSDIADFRVQITHAKNLKVATSGAQTVTENAENTTTTAQIKNARDFAAVIGSFNVESKNHGGVSVDYYYIADENPQKAVKTACDSLDTFSNMFGEYAYTTLSVVKTPFLHGGMEYPALIYISDIAEPDAFTEVIIHETAHQWWYAAVGSDQVNEPWLDEGLTEYSTSLFYEANPEYGVSINSRLATSLATYLLYIERFCDNGFGDTSMNRPSGEYTTSSEYTVMTYVKGQLMFDSLRQTIGKKNVMAGLKKYYHDFKLKTASGELFIATMESASNTQLKSFFETWLEGKAHIYAK